MSFENRGKSDRKSLKERRLSLEHLEKRALLSVSPGITQLLGSQYIYGIGGSSAYSSRATAVTAAQYSAGIKWQVQSGVQTTVQLAAVDSSGRMVRNYNGTANLVSSDKSATLPSTVMFQGGLAIFQVTFNTSGQETVTATDSSNTSLTGTATTTVLAPDVATQYYVQNRPTVQSGVQTSLQIYALDANGYLVRNYNGTATVASSDSAAVTAKTIPTSVTFVNGVATLQVAFATAGSQTVTVTDTTTSTKFSATAAVNVTAPVVPTQYVINLRSKVQSGVPVSVQVLAEDAYGNIIRNYSGTATIASSDTAAVTAKTIPTSVTFVNGIATFQATFATAGNQTITASDGDKVIKSATATTTVVASLTPTPTPTPTPSPTPAATSTNWSGYAAETSLRSPQSGSVTAVSGSWAVPAVTGTGTAYSSVWVGIDGYQSATVEQIGTESDLVNGTAQYSVWYEMYPTGSVAITLTNAAGKSVAVAAGDSITASVQYIASGTSAGQFELTITDVTAGGSYTTYQNGGKVQRSSAEWIVEAPSSNRGILPLANFGTVTFASATATINGTTGAIDNSAWQSTAINMVSNNRVQEDTTSVLTDASSVSSFTVTYNSSGGSSTGTPGNPGQGFGGGGWHQTAVLAQNADSAFSGSSPLGPSDRQEARDRLFASLELFRI